MRLGELRKILGLAPLALRRVWADVLRRPPADDETELTDTEAALLCLADFCETFFNLAQPTTDLLRKLWEDFRANYESPEAWSRPYQVRLIDRRFAVWPKRAAFFDLSSLEDVPELPGPPVQVHSVDATEYFRRAQHASRRPTTASV